MHIVAGSYCTLNLLHILFFITDYWVHDMLDGIVIGFRVSWIKMAVAVSGMNNLILVKFSVTPRATNANEWTRREKKRKYNSSSSGPSQLSVEQDEDIDYSTLDTDEKINLILSKVTLNESRFW